MRTIIVTESDHRNLQALLTSEFAKVIGHSHHVDELNAELRRAQIVSPDKVPDDVVTMNSRVTFRDLVTGEHETYTLVLPHDADIAEGRLSILAPIGTAIIGERVGNVVHWRVPDGRRSLKIEEVVHEPERESVFYLG